MVEFRRIACSCGDQHYTASLVGRQKIIFSNTDLKNLTMCIVPYFDVAEKT
jgi:hypothetical protein